MKKVLGAGIACLIAAPAFGGAIIASENFDGGAFNLIGTSNVFAVNAGGGAPGDAFGVVTPFNGGLGTGGPFDVWDDSVTDTSSGGVFPTDSLAVAGQNTTGFFAINDPDGIAGGTLNNAVWSFDISSAASLKGVLIDIGAFGDFEASSTDGFLIEAQVDGGGYVEIFKGRTNEAIGHTYRAFDDGDIFTLQDPLELYIDGVNTGIVLDKSDPVTGLFDTFTSVALAGQSGLQLDIRVSWAGTPSGSEPIGLDNFRVWGNIPAPGAIALLGLAGLTARRRRNA